mmetsp:Transcript_30865/g.71689  ORF Transcript_30865/g.71689 Transcript_30865/m.71689 type:complete len:481 (+) Transcript_30865:103-1545(+)
MGDAERWFIPAAAQVLLFLLLVGMAASVDTTILRERFRRCGGIAFGLTCQFVVLPFIGFVSVKAFDMPPAFGIALLAVTSSPGGAYSNWWCSLFNADLGLSVAMTTCSTLVSIFFTPLNMFLYSLGSYGKLPEINWWKMFASIFVALLAIPTGVCCSFHFPAQRSKFNFAGNIAGLCLIIFSTVVSSRETPLWDKGPKFYAGVAAPCVSGLLLAFSIAHLSPCITGPEAVAVTVETSYQNTGLAMTIALATFNEEERGNATSVPLFYGAVQVIFLPLFLVVAWKAGWTYAPRNTGIIPVLLCDWQPCGSAQVSPAEPVSPTSPATPFDGSAFPEVPPIMIDGKSDATPASTCKVVNDVVVDSATCSTVESSGRGHPETDPQMPLSARSTPMPGHLEEVPQQALSARSTLMPGQLNTLEPTAAALSTPMTLQEDQVVRILPTPRSSGQSLQGSSRSNSRQRLWELQRTQHKTQGPPSCWSS